MSKINNFQIPEELLALIKNGKWCRPDEPSTIMRVLGDVRVEYLNFLTLNEMKASLENLRRLANAGYNDCYGLYSSKLSTGSKDSKAYLDVEMCIPIIEGIDEEIVCLDYSENSSSPRLLMSVYDQPVRWEVVALNFSSFMADLEMNPRANH